MNQAKILCKATTHVIYQLVKGYSRCYCYHSSNQEDYKDLIGSLIPKSKYRRKYEGELIKDILENSENIRLLRFFKIIDKSEIMFLQELQNAEAEAYDQEELIETLIEFFVDFGYTYEPYLPSYIKKDKVTEPMRVYFNKVRSNINAKKIEVKHYEEEFQKQEA